MPSYFDVKKLPPYTSDCIATRSINLMCAILRGITYKELYDTPFHDRSGNSPLDRIIFHINNLHPDLQVGATGNSRIVIPILAGTGGAFARIRLVLNEPGTPEIKLGDLFHQKRLHPTLHTGLKLKNFIVDTLESVHTSTNDPMYHFCVPFLKIQLDSTRPRPTEPEYRRFITKLGHKTLQDFYESPYNDEERNAAIAARQLGIFKEKRPQGSKPGGPTTKTKDGNQRHCVNGACCGSNDPEDWCNSVIINGNEACALGSDYGTQCYSLVGEGGDIDSKKTDAKKSAIKKSTAGKAKPRKAAARKSTPKK